MILPDDPTKYISVKGMDCAKCVFCDDCMSNKVYQRDTVEEFNGKICWEEGGHWELKEESIQNDKNKVLRRIVEIV